ncbi:MAG TPA: hypothetical protein VNA89_14735 [Gemmatimonadaceae bacterium]|nr:hypothetical protein [Gemmatimonadaceae bacterium]
MTAAATPAPGAQLEAGRCAACGEPEALDLVICPRCAASAPEAADTLIVLRGAERAYARVPAALAPVVLGRLADEGRTARAVPARRAWVAIPGRTWVLILAIVVSGAAAAAVAAPALRYVTPLVALGLLVAAERAMRGASAAADASSDAALPPRLRRPVVDALAALPPGESRALLTDVVRRARPLLASLSGAEDGAAVARDVDDLVLASCDIALEHARLDALLRDTRDGAGGADDARRRCEEGRDLLARRLRDASAAVGATYAQRVERGTPAAERVAELASELTAEAAARRDAAVEIERLLGR